MSEVFSFVDATHLIAKASLWDKRDKCKGFHLAAIKNNNIMDKNKDKYRWYSKIRSPYERVFAGRNKNIRYVGIAKN